jgi:hypothetical protein
VELADEQLWGFRDQLLAALALGPFDAVGLAEASCAFIDAAGKEAPPRRARARLVIGFAAEFYRQLLRGLMHTQPVGDQALVQSVERALSSWPGDAETATACIDRTLAALGHIDRNAHLRGLVECWLDEVARTVQTGHPAVSRDV